MMYTPKIALVMILDQLIVPGMFSSEFLMVLVPFEARSERVRDTLVMSRDEERRRGVRVEKSGEQGKYKQKI